MADNIKLRHKRQGLLLVGGYDLTQGEFNSRAISSFRDQTWSSCQFYQKSEAFMNVMACAKKCVTLDSCLYFIQTGESCTVCAISSGGDVEDGYIFSNYSVSPQTMAFEKEALKVCTYGPFGIHNETDFFDDRDIYFAIGGKLTGIKVFYIQWIIGMSVRYGDQWQPVRGSSEGSVSEQIIGQDDYIESITLRSGDSIDTITFNIAGGSSLKVGSGDGGGQAIFKVCGDVFFSGASKNGKLGQLTFYSQCITC